MSLRNTQSTPHSCIKRGYLNSEPSEIAKRIKRPHAPFTMRNTEYWMHVNFDKKCRFDFAHLKPEPERDLSEK